MFRYRRLLAAIVVGLIIFTLLVTYGLYYARAR